MVDMFILISFFTLGLIFGGKKVSREKIRADRYYSALLREKTN